jgi:ankyrin repeat protein
MLKQPNFALAAKKDFANFQDVFSRIVDINAPDVDGICMILYAVSEKRLDIATFILTHGGDPNVKSDISTRTFGQISGDVVMPKEGYLIEEHITPLHLAASNCDYGMTTLLLSHGADINCVSLKEFTPLMYCVSSGKPYINRRGQLKLERNNPEIRSKFCQFLLGNGTNRSFTSSLGRSFDTLIKEYYALPGF